MNDHRLLTKCKVCTVKYRTEATLHGGQCAISLQKECNCTNKNLIFKYIAYLCNICAIFQYFMLL